MTIHLCNISSEVPYSIIIYGIVSNLREYKFAWTLNNNLNLWLEKNKDLDSTQSHRVGYISSLQYENEKMKFVLVNNMIFDTEDNYQGKIFTSRPPLDYLIFIKNIEGNINPHNIEQQLRRIPKIDYCFLMDTKYLDKFDFIYKLID